MQINTVTVVLTFSAIALMHQSIPPAPIPPPFPRATAAEGGGWDGDVGAGRRWN